jgi:flagellar basal-body rod protein FlgG
VIYGLYQSAAGMLVNEYRQGVIANNLANAETPGFKRDMALFAERLPARTAGERAGASRPLLDPLTGGIWLARTETDFRPGPMQNTGEALDVALDGPGFFLVEAEGQTLATRDGRFVKDFYGNLLAASDGAPVLGAGGQPVRLNPHGEAPLIDEEGRIWQGKALMGQLAVADYADYGRLRKVEGGRFDPTGQPPISPPSRVAQGYVEGSGVEAVRELVTMIEASRAYQLNASLLSLQDQTTGRLVNSLQG